jgi:hypothetical protein
VATSDPDGWEADQIEFDAADGPCFELLVKDNRGLPVQEALASRSTIDQALGVLMAQNRRRRSARTQLDRRNALRLPSRKSTSTHHEPRTGRPAAPAKGSRTPRL